MQSMFIVVRLMFSILSNLLFYPYPNLMSSLLCIGVWEYNPIERRNMWSDTGSFEHNSRGDILKFYNANAMNLEGTNQHPGK